jgi:hypothetical protein
VSRTLNLAGLLLCLCVGASAAHAQGTGSVQTLESTPGVDARASSSIVAAHQAEVKQSGMRSEARLSRVEALLREGDLDEASKEMTLYLAGRDIKGLPLQVRQLWDEIDTRKKAEAAYAEATSSREQLNDYLRRMAPELQGLEAAQDQKPLEPILKAVGKNVGEFVRDFPNTVSLERIHQEKLGRNEKVQESLGSQTQYLCLSSDGAWGPGFEEYRTNRGGTQGGAHGLGKGFMLTSGFTSVSLLFHPAYLSETSFRYLGRQKIFERVTQVIAFAQQPAKARLRGTFKMAGVSRTTLAQGLAWVDPETFQILRLRTDLLAPVPEVGLERETTEIEYGEVYFSRLREAFWLPRQVTVTVAWNGKRLRNQHQYSDFKLFNVEVTQQIRKPGETAQTSEPARASTPPQ